MVTGGASGIGRATCVELAAQGASIVVADMDEAGAVHTAGSCGADAIVCAMDVSCEPHWERAMQRVLERFGRLDILCNVAGIGRGGFIDEIRLEDWNAMLAVNLTGTMLGCKHGVRTISSSGGRGAILNVSSVGGTVGIADVAGYCASKGGVTILTKAVALRCAQQRWPIRCISVHPTYVDTEMLDPVAAAFGNRKTLLDGMARLVPMGRVCNPTDVSRMLAFLASDDAGMVSGSEVYVDGAQLAGVSSAHFDH